MSATKCLRSESSSTSSRALKLLAIGISALLLLAVIGATRAEADEAACSNSSASLGPDGTTVYLSPCEGEIVVESPTVTTIVGSPGDDVIKASENVETIYAGEGDDTVYAGPETTLIQGGGGEDTIYGEPVENEVGPEEGDSPEYEPEVVYEPASRSTMSLDKSSAGLVPDRGAKATASVACPETEPCLGDLGDQTIEGGEGNDFIFGERGNDVLIGNGGNDALYGGIGDDTERGGSGNDFIAGGGGADIISGETGDDLVRGDGTIDTISGNSGTDTVSFSTGVTPGFEGSYPSGITHVTGFPEDPLGEGRGVYVRLDGNATNCGYPSCDGGAGLAGGADSLTEVENVIGTAFPDIIVGSSAANKIYGGGGGDVIIGAGGADEMFGGAEGDYIEDSSSGTAYGGKGTNTCVGVSSKGECTGTGAKVSQQEASTMTAGVMMTKNPVASRDTVYLIGSESADEVNAHFEAGTHTVTFTSYGSTVFAGESEGCTYETNKKAKCALPASSAVLDAVVMAGLKGNDHFSDGGAPAFELATTPILLGGEGNDVLSGGGQTEDTLVDGNGTGNDTSKGFGYDDWLLNNGGVDLLEGGMGNDLLLSVTTCDGDTLQGGEAGKDDGEARNDASWAKLPGEGGVTADIEEKIQKSGSYFNEATGEPACTSGTTDNLYGIDDLEGSNQGDALLGGLHQNLLIGHKGEDNLQGAAGEDKVNAVDGGPDKVGGGPDTDECLVDLPADKPITGCENTKPEPKTTTTLAEPEPHNGAPGSAGSVTLKGNVAANGSLAEYKVRLNLSKEEKGEWVLKTSPEAKLPESGNYTVNEGVGAGKWRVKAVFYAGQAPYEPSESGYKEFTITN